MQSIVQARAREKPHAYDVLAHQLNQILRPHEQAEPNYNYSGI
jgi:hypothetical protein